jgi:ketosteroid isomerase-like protein
MEQLPPFLQALLRDWHAHDAEAVAAHYADDGVMVDPMTDEKPIQGTEAIRNYYRKVWSDTPDARLEPLACSSDANGVVWMWRFSGSTDGEPWEAVGASYLALGGDGLIAWDRAVWDISLMTPG